MATAAASPTYAGAIEALILGRSLVVDSRASYPRAGHEPDRSIKSVTAASGAAKATKW